MAGDDFFDGAGSRVMELKMNLPPELLSARDSAFFLQCVTNLEMKEPRSSPGE